VYVFGAEAMELPSIRWETSTSP